MDVAAQCRLAARKFSDSGECAECSTEAMTLGLEALNAALSCAEARAWCLGVERQPWMIAT
eukprot:Skav208431  [mRNA]  locus=scaffold2953:586554:587683:- [translate_table: standard]